MTQCLNGGRIVSIAGKRCPFEGLSSSETAKDDDDGEEEESARKHRTHLKPGTVRHVRNLIPLSRKGQNFMSVKDAAAGESKAR